MRYKTHVKKQPKVSNITATKQTKKNLNNKLYLNYSKRLACSKHDFLQQKIF